LQAQLQRELSPFQLNYKARKSRSKVSQFTGVSEGQLSKEKFIVKATQANPAFGNLLSKIDSGKVSVDQAYKEVKDELWKEKQLAENKLAETSFSEAHALLNIYLLHTPVLDTNH
jgi:hypothetical protein